jgi:surfeit locus 1 family protein
MFRSFFSLRWILATLLVLIGVGGMIRLGIWQLERLAERRASNAQVTAEINAPQLDLSLGIPQEQLTEMEYRTAVVRGTYDFAQEVVLRSQVLNGNLGYDVITPLKIEDSNYDIMVNRGWIPYDQAQPDQRAKYFEPGMVTVKGLLRLPQSQSALFGDPDPTLATGQTRLDAWNAINLTRLQKQVDSPILPVYIQQAPDPSWTSMPYRSTTLPDLSDGPHLFYAIQWFFFAATLTTGYPIFVRRRYKRKPKQGGHSPPQSA